MGRRKIEIKAIKDDRNRSVTFLKRKGGLFKKAHELAVLCSVDVAVIIFGHNKKLYQYSSSEMPQLLGQYQYFGPPHESKVPEDYNKQEDDEDDEDHTPAPEEMQAQQPHPGVPPHLHQQPGFQHINHAPSASPPMANGLPIRHGTPQSHGSRPNSRNHIRRVSSNLGPHQHQHGTPPPPGAPNGFYMSNPSMYNPNVHSAMNQQQPRPGQYAQYGHPGPQGTPPQGIAHPHGLPPQHPQHPQHQQHQQHQQQHQQQMPPQQHFQHPHAVAPQQMGMPPGSHAPIPQVTQTYMAEQGRGSMPPAFSADNQEHAAPENQDNTSGGLLKPEPGDSPPHSKSFTKRSIFTPIDDRGSVLAQHFMGGGNMYESHRPNQPIKQEKPRDDSPAAKPARMNVASEPPRTQSVSSLPEIKPPQRTNSAQFPSKRPQLKVQIPSESSEHGGSATAESSSRDSTGNRTTPAKTGGDNPPPSGVVLPPPSPSAGAILSAGAHGPPNPFARPQPPVPQPPQPPSALGNGHSNGSNNIETPISALPSRYVGDLLPSPSSFFPEWGFGRSGPDSSLLPSPLTFPTPAVQSGPSFAREDEQDKKRKEPDGGSQDDAASKKPKT